MTPNTIQFSGTGSTWVMRITADRRIEVNEDVDVTEAAQKVLDALQHLLKPAPVQEPVAKKTGIGLVTANGWDSLPVGTLLYTAPQPVPVKTYHDGKPWPVAPKPWVGLSEKEVEAYDSWADFQVGCGRQTLFDMVRDIEAKLKEKNHV